MAIGVHGLVRVHVVVHVEEVSRNGKENVMILRQNTEDKAQIVKAGSADDLIEERGLDDRFKCAGLCFAAPRHG